MDLGGGGGAGLTLGLGLGLRFRVQDKSLVEGLYQADCLSGPLGTFRGQGLGSRVKRLRGLGF